MNYEQDYLAINKALWNAKTPVHVESDFYDTQSFINGANTLNDIELKLLGNLKGKKVLHLQCHYGMDTLSLARLGAQVTGIDLSDVAIAQAQQLNDQLGLTGRFICSDVYGLPDVLHETFDIVFTSYGTIGWLPDMERWAKVVNHFVKPGGQFIIAEFHPVVWIFNNEFTSIDYPYFNRQVIVDQEEGTYADNDAKINLTGVSWNHPLSDVIQNLLNTGLQLKSLEEYDYSPYPCFQNVVTIAPNKYNIKGLEGKIPMVYSLLMAKP